MIWIYNVLLTLFMPIWVPWMIWRTKKRKEQPNWAERRGSYPFQLTRKDETIWVHAVSVGEVVAALPILKCLRENAPDAKIVLSVTTSSGHETASTQAKDFVDYVVYFPIDMYLFQSSAMAHVRPDVIAIMETELWMNFLDVAKILGAKTMLINGRISDRSYPRSLKLQFFYESLLRRVDRCLMQSETDRERILRLGAKSAEVFGNCKFDQAAQVTISRDWRTELAIPPGARVVVVASTRSEEEEDLVIAALKGFECYVIHAPRHIERAESILAKVEGSARRSRGETGRYLILDTFGELSEVFSIADLAIVGGGFSNLGGQNLIQPLAFGVPVLHGPHMQNFADVTAAALKAGASRECGTAEELRRTVQELMADDAKRAEMSEKALALIQASTGASERYARAILDALAEHRSAIGLRS